MLLGEVVAPALPALGLPILVILLWAIALGLLVLVLYLTHVLTWLLQNTLGRLPWIGDAIASVVEALSSTITTTFGSAISGVDKQISFWWHTLGEVVSWTYNELRAHANLLLIMSTVLLGQTGALAIYRAVHWLRGHVAAITHTLDTLLHKLQAVERFLEHPERGLLGKALSIALKPIEARIGQLERWTYPKVGSIEGEIGKVIEPDIAALRDAAQTLENQAIRVYQDAAGVWHAVNVDAIAAAMVLALPSLGWQFLRCSALGSSFSSRGCGLFSGLEDVLGLLADTVLLGSACEIIPLVETVVSDVAVPIVEGLTDIGAGLCSGGIGAAPALPVQKLYLPANPGYQLSLP